jgi:uncharacterized membrane protein YeaQ/YmgE (transglycosylase-associated protein family)
MSILAWIVIGLIAGWLAHVILGGRGGIFGNLAVGLVGAILGGFLFEKLNLHVMPDFWGQSDHGHDWRHHLPADLAGDQTGVTVYPPSS